MPEEQNKFFSGDGEYAPLAELVGAKSGDLGLDYFLSLARRGRLKAFKIGDEWYSSKKWLEDFKAEIKNQFRGESFAAGSNWVRYLPAKKRTLAGRIVFFVFFGWLVWLFIRLAGPRQRKKKD